jgi:hypothetical protein
MILSVQYILPNQYCCVCAMLPKLSLSIIVIICILYCTCQIVIILLCHAAQVVLVDNSNYMYPILSVPNCYCLVVPCCPDCPAEFWAVLLKASVLRPALLGWLECLLTDLAGWQACVCVCVCAGLCVCRLVCLSECPCVCGGGGDEEVVCMLVCACLCACVSAWIKEYRDTPPSFVLKHTHTHTHTHTHKLRKQALSLRVLRMPIPFSKLESRHSTRFQIKSECHFLV